MTEDGERTHTSWAQLWLRALDRLAVLAPGRIDPGAVVEVEPGNVTVTIGEHTTRLGVAPLPSPAWDTLVETVLASPSLTAAALTGELPAELAESLGEAGISLTPSGSEVVGDCSCGHADRGCRHLGAVVAIVARALGSDPWLLVTLRGSDRSILTDRVAVERARRMGRPASAPTAEPRPRRPQLDARDALGRAPKALPPPPPMLRRPRAAGELPPAPLDSGIDAERLRLLVDDAARRSVELLAGDGDGGLNT